MRERKRERNRQAGKQTDMQTGTYKHTSKCIGTHKQRNTPCAKKKKKGTKLARCEFNYCHTDELQTNDDALLLMLLRLLLQL